MKNLELLNKNNAAKGNLLNLEEIYINKKIIPLFSNPVNFKQKNFKTNKFKIKINPNQILFSGNLSTPITSTKQDIELKSFNNNLKSTNKITYKLISLNEILKIYLRGINLYNITLNNLLLLNNNKLKLIKELKYDEYNKLNIIYNNYLYLLNRFLPKFKLRSLIYKLELFGPLRILKYNNIYTYTYRLRSLYLNKNMSPSNKYYLKYLESIANPNTGESAKDSNKIKEINIKMISKLLEKGDNLSLLMNSLINKKKYIINNSRLKNLLSPVLNLIEDQINKKSLLKLLVEKQNKKNNYDNLLTLNKNKLNIDLSFNNIHKNNENYIRNTRKSILNYFNFDLKSDVLYNNNISSPVEVKYLQNNYSKPIINQYLKEMSKFNMCKKGIFIYYKNIIGFNFNSNTNKLIKNIYKLLFSTFKSMYCLISKPVFVITPDKIKIQLFYYLFLPNLLKLKKYNLLKKNKRIKNHRSNRDLRKEHYNFKLEISKFRKFKNTEDVNLITLSSNALTKVFSNKFKILCNILSNLFKKPVELNLSRLHYPYFDSNILVNLLGIMINKIKLRIIIRTLFHRTIVKNLNSINLRDNNMIPAFLTGINIKVAGRLLTQRVVPRKTVKNVIKGISNRSKVNFLDVGRYSNKNRRGAFSITVRSGQNYF